MSITTNSSASFLNWQPSYAERGIATFPVGDDKVPAIRGYQRVGRRGSGELARKFPDAPAIGFMCGPRSGVTVLDIDTNDERVVADAVDRHGKTPIIVRTGSGNYQAWYRHGGERRLIRPRRDVPIDILGGGYVVAPASRVAKGNYEFIQGSLDDLSTLPTLNDAPSPAREMRGMRQGDGRNNRLFKLALRAVKNCDDFDQLLDWGRTQNGFCAEPMDDKEVVGIMQNAWRYESSGLNRAGAHGAWLTQGEVDLLVADPYELALLSWLDAHNGRDSQFLVADGLQHILGWPRRPFQIARRSLIERGRLIPLTRPRPGKPVLYRWGQVSEGVRAGSKR